ncbi:hypothetical protein HU200_035643 [Digitaria exilis]|uniref:Uncharacterized protein n=1 Tax=Digitaria exilis TaxID=1010633 RepID=A0A835BIG3_9POAL|nr:hypothetical protein HU200_035643 [Digitaria exilis]
MLGAISESDKQHQSDRERHLLSKPIKLFNETKELFAGSSANGSLAMDKNTCMDDSDGSDSDAARELFDLNTYTQPEDLLGEDSYTLPTPTRNATVDNSSFGTSRAAKKFPRGNKSPAKKPKKASLWQKLEAIPMTPDQRVLVGEHLSTKENKGKLGWLGNASADTLHAWVFKFLCEKEDINL